MKRSLAALAITLATVAVVLNDNSTAVSASPTDQLSSLVRSRIKHVFIIYQENQSFDHYFGTYPAAENLASQSAQSHGFRQWDPIGERWVTPFKIVDPDVSSPGHGRPLMIAKNDGGRMDGYVAAQGQASLKDYSRSDARRIGLGELSYYDCDGIPFLWKYAQGFALYDHFFDGMAGPSTPGNIEAIAGQAGQTQWARYPDERSTGKKPGDPILNDLDPPFGPYPGKPDRVLQVDQRYATVLLTLSGRNNAQATHDVSGVAEDLASVAGRPSIPWGWYQEGYTGPGLTALPGYEAHHNAVQYFGY